MRFPELGIYLLPGHTEAPADRLREVREAEALGLGSAWISERFDVKARGPRPVRPRHPSRSKNSTFRGSAGSRILCGVSRRGAPKPRKPVKLYSGPLSLFSAKVRIALDEKGVDYEKVEVGWSLAHRYEPHHPDVVALNPKRQVPVLVDGDVVVYDSTLILEYLEERCPEPPLYPSGLAERARCRRLEAAADETLFPHVWSLIDGGFYPTPENDGAGERKRTACSELARLQLELDKQLAGCEHLCDRFSVADIGSFIMLSTAATLGAPPAAAHTNLQAWLARVAGRPAVKREIDGMQAFVRGLRPARASA